MDLYGMILVAVALAMAPALIEGVALLVVSVLRIAGRLIIRPIRRTEREAALSHASYGVVMLISAAHFNIPIWAVTILALWGGTWVLTGFGWRSRGIRDGTLIQKFLVRLAIGCAALIFVPPWPQAIEPLRYLGWLLAITAAVKLALVMRG